MMTRIFSNVLMLFAIVLLISCGTPLEDYQPKNAQEKEIKHLLLEFAKARNDYNVPGMVTLMSDDCKINIFTRELSKSQFAQWKAKDLEDYGQCRFTNPEISVTDGVAVTKLRCSQGPVVTLAFSFKIIQQNNSWVISEWAASQN